jgi:microsomal dipeptidase-like Zn-dependent dipeptidase
MSRTVKLLLALGGAVLGCLAILFSLPSILDGRMNGIMAKPPYTITERARTLHQTLFVADLHADPLLWNRDLQELHDYGHIDVPRLQQGRVALQIFAAVTKAPRGQNFDRTSGDTDNVTLLTIAQRWPPRTWNSLLERALYQSEKLRHEAAASDGALRIVRSRSELDAFVSAGSAAPSARHATAALLALEGLHPLEGRLENLDKLYDAGFRMAGLTHFFDNELGGSAHGISKGGLTRFGRKVVRRLESKKMIVDLAHASSRVIDEVLAMARRPIVVSHTGVRATCPGPRNLSDAHIRAIAANGGLLGIGYFPGAVCRATPSGIVQAMRHVVDLVGIQHVALGSDFDGATTTAFDASGVVLITQELLRAGFSADDVAKIMGGNVKAFLLAQLPDD